MNVDLPFLAVRPLWTAVEPAARAVGLPARTLLHAGPPYRDPTRPPPPVLSSAVMVLLHEGLAADAAVAERMIADGAVQLQPAQDWGVVTPLAEVVGPATPLTVVRDEAGPGRWCAPLPSGAGAQLRFGTRDPRLPDRLALRDRVLAPALAAAVAEAPVDLMALAAAGLAGGDDLHGSTTAATLALSERLAPRLGEGPALAAITGLPLFFLTLWMAAARLMLGASEGHPPPGLIIQVSANGESLGLSIADVPDRMVTLPAPVPRGPRLAPGDDRPASPAIGDSAVIDALGLGAQALADLPTLHTALADHLPAAPPPLLADHPLLGRRLGIDAAAAEASGLGVVIAQIAADGEGGLLGRGAVTVPGSLLAQALAGGFTT